MSEPRVFPEGSPLPADVFKVRDSMGDVWERNAISDVDLWFTPETVPMTWARIAKKYAPLTEVLPAAPAAVSPNAPTPGLTRYLIARALDRGEEIEVPGLGIVALDEEPVPEGPVGVSGEISVSAGKTADEDAEPGTGDLRATVGVTLLSFYGPSATADQCDHVASMTGALCDALAGWQPPLGMEPWRVDARIQEQRATSLGYCEHVDEVHGEPEECGELRERGSTFCSQHQSAPVVAETPVQAVQRAASWWEAAKTLNRWGNLHREAHRKGLIEIDNLAAVRDELARQRDDHRARADAAEAKLAVAEMAVSVERAAREAYAARIDQVRARFAEVDDKSIFSDEALFHIRRIVDGEVQR